jgi:hypothetical protein
MNTRKLARHPESERVLKSSALAAMTTLVGTFFEVSGKKNQFRMRERWQAADANKVATESGLHQYLINSAVMFLPCM